MSREAFEKWYEEEYGTEFGRDFRNDDVIEKSFLAGYQAAKPKWIPYKEGDSVVGGWYLVTHKNRAVTTRHRQYEKWLYAPLSNPVIAYRPLPAPFGGE